MKQVPNPRLRNTDFHFVLFQNINTRMGKILNSDSYIIKFENVKGNGNIL